MFNVYIQKHLVNQIQINRSAGQSKPDSDTDTIILYDMENLKQGKTE